MKILAKIRDAFRLKPGEPGKAWDAEKEEIKKLVALMMHDDVIVEEPRDMWIESEAMAAGVAATFAILRRDDPDWKKLDRQTARCLYVGVAATLLCSIYKKDSVFIRRAEEHEKHKENK